MVTPRIFPKEKENPLPVEDVSVHGNSDVSTDRTSEDVIPPTYKKTVTEGAETENSYDNIAFTKDNGEVRVDVGVEEEVASL